MIQTLVLAVSAVIIYIAVPYLGMLSIKKVLGISLFLQVFYIIGALIGAWDFPHPLQIAQIIVTVALGVALGAVFSKLWPLAQKPGFERIFRTFLLVVPSLGIGMGLQILLQEGRSTQAIYLIFALSAWLGSAHFMRKS